MLAVGAQKNYFSQNRAKEVITSKLKQRTLYVVFDNL
jgi:hypothetical protein